MKHQSYFAGLALLGLLSTVQAAPVELSTAQGKGADTSVRGGDLKTRSFGNLDILRVRNATGLTGARKTYLRFDLSALAAPAKSANAATLDLPVAPAEASSPENKNWTFQVYGLKDGVDGEAWPESSTNWENAPANNKESGTALTEDAQALGTFSLTGKGKAGEVVSFSSPELLHFLQADTNGTATLIIGRQEAGDAAAENVVHIFASKEHKTLAPPKLRLNFGADVAVAPQPQNKQLRLFVIGNSFSQNATRFLPQIAREGGVQLIIGRAEAPSRSLQMHWEAVEAAEANPQDEKGRIYNGKTLKDLLSVGHWDVVTMQQGSWQSADLSTYKPYARKLYDFIKQLQPKAEVVMHQTWTYRSDAPKFAPVGSNQLANTDREMWEKSREAYRTTAGELGMRVLPVGDAFWRVASDPKWSFKKDATYDYNNPAYPAVPTEATSLHAGYRWNGQKKLELDPRHASDAGCYLGGLVWAGGLWGQDPAKVTFAPAGVDAEFASFLRQTAAAVLRDTKAPAQILSAAA